MAVKAEKSVASGKVEKTEKTEQKFEKEAFSEFTMLQHLESELKKYGALNTFPDDGLERYDSLMDRIYPTKEKVGYLKHRISSELELAAQINKNPAAELFKKNSDITYLEKRIAGMGEHETKLKIIDKDIEQRSNKLKDEINKLFPYWTDKAEIIEKKLSSLDFSFAIIEQFNSYCDELSEVEQLQSDIRKKIDNGEQSKRDLEEKIREIRKQILDITSNESTDSIRSDIVKIREAILYKEEIECEIRSLEQYRKDLLLELCEAEGFSSPVSELRIMLISQLAFSLCCAIIVLVWHIFNSEMLPYTIFTLSVIFSFAIFSIFIYHSGLKKDKEQINILSMFIDKKENTVDSIEEKITNLEYQEDEIIHDIKELSSKLNIPIIDYTNIEELSEQFEFARLKLRKYADVKEQERQLSEAIERLNSNMLLYRQEMSKLDARGERNLSSWRKWLLKNYFPEHIAIGEFDSFISCAKAAQGKLEVLNTLRREAQSERKYIQSTDELVYDFCSSMNIKSADIHNVFNSIKEAATLKKRLEEVNDNIVRLNSEKKATEEILEKYSTELRSLFAEVNVKSEKEFMELASIWEQNWILNAKLEETWHKLSVICGSRKIAEKYVKEKRQGLINGRFDE